MSTFEAETAPHPVANAKAGWTRRRRRLLLGLGMGLGLALACGVLVSSVVERLQDASDRAR